MADENGGPEIDEFAMFRARSLGVECEYLEMARVGKLRNQRNRCTGSSRTSTTSDLPEINSPETENNTSQRLTSGSQNKSRSQHRTLENTENGSEPADLGLTTYRNSNGKEDSLSPEVDSLDPEGLGGLHRAHSYRSNKRPNSRGLEFGAGGEPEEESKFNRSRTMTMPARRKTSKREGASGFGNKLDNRMHNRDEEPEPQTTATSPTGGDGKIADRAVLRVRNFSTKSGNVINRGDSIKIRNLRSGGIRGNKGENGNFREGGGSHFSASATHLASSPLSSSPRKPHLSRRFQSEEEEPASMKRLLMTTSRNSSAADVHIGEGINVIITQDSNENPGADFYGRSCDDKEEEIQEENENDLENIDDMTGRQELMERRDRGGGKKSNKPEEGDEETTVYKVMVMGSHGVGKTTLTQQLLTSEYLANNDYDMDDESTDKIVSVQVDGEESMLQFIDCAGTQGIKRKNVQVDANLVVYSVTDRTSYSFAQSCLQDLRPAKRHNVVILVANKQDLVRGRVISEDDGKSLAAKRHCKFIEVSALLSHKMDELLVGITRQIRLRKATGTSQPSHRGGVDSQSEYGEGRLGCLQRAALDVFRRFFRRRRPVESNSCDDLFTP